MKLTAGCWHRRTGQFFLGGRGEPSLPENFFDNAQKNCYANSQNYFVPRTHPVIVKMPDFGHFISLDRMNSVFSFNKYTNFFSFLAAGFCPKNLAFARVWGLQPLSPLARTPMSAGVYVKKVFSVSVTHPDFCFGWVLFFPFPPPSLIAPPAGPAASLRRILELTRNTLDCDQSNVNSERIIFLSVLPKLSDSFLFMH